MNTNAEMLISEVLNTHNSIVNIDINDVRDLFQDSEEIHAFEVSVPADNENRMALLMEQIKKCSECHKPYNQALVFFFFPEKCPLMMEELKPFCEWVESVPGELMIKWGMATQSAQEIRAIVLLQ